MGGTAPAVAHYHRRIAVVAEADRMSELMGDDIASDIGPRQRRDAVATDHHQRNPAHLFVGETAQGLRELQSDLFHQSVPVEFIERVWMVMGETPRHTYQILTKRPERMAEVLSGKQFKV